MGKGFCNSCIRSYSAIPASNNIAHHAQVAWKRMARASVLNGRTHLPINRIAQAVSLGLSRSYIVVPGIFTLMCGTQIAWAQATPEADIFQPRNTLYMRAEDSHLFLTTLILSAFECIFLLLRALYLAVLFTPSVAMAPFADSFGPQYRKLWLQVVHQTLERAGPAFIKWGQWAATRPDLFPRDLCTELSNFTHKHLNIALPTQKRLLKKLLVVKFLKFLMTLRKNLWHLEVLLKCIELLCGLVTAAARSSQC
ncbi:UNVERIFIED_CONTAM: ABC1 family protein C21C3.03, mitochondrial [Sesamum radiatum]|uniref:ABC1 family protein C21C3.03, mitochondrial n=1 Tax=Sesamum radiatum TaxID=300843 RepID=A0AAW2LSC8_SESRA